MILEASSDLVLLLDHSRYERHMNSAMTYLCAAKNRHGPTIEIPIEWDYRTLSVREGDPHEEHLWPEKREVCGRHDQLFKFGIHSRTWLR